MNKIRKYSAYISTLVLFASFSCNSEMKQKDIENTRFIVDSTKLNISKNSIQKDNVVHFDTIKCDTIIGDLSISYIIRDNNNTITKQVITSEGDSILLVYADRSVFLNLKQSDGRMILSRKEINKYTFKSILSNEDLNQYQLWFFSIKNVDKDGVLFNVNVCIPDTDICYCAELHILKNGNFIISKREFDEED